MKWTRVTAVMLLVIPAQSWASDPDSPPASPPEAAAATGTGEWQSRERGTATLPWQVEVEKFGDGAVLGWLRVLGSDCGVDASNLSVATNPIAPRSTRRAADPGVGRIIRSRASSA